MPPSPFGSLVRHCEEAILPSPPAEPAELTALLDLVSTIPDPPRVRGRRYRLGSLLALCLVAVLGGACSLAQIARFAASSFAGPQPPWPINRRERMGSWPRRRGTTKFALRCARR